MKAAVWYGRKDVRVENVSEPPAPGKEEDKIKVFQTGICGSDLHEYDAGPDTTFRLSGIWELSANIALIPQIEYFSERSLYYSVDDDSFHRAGGVSLCLNRSSSMPPLSSSWALGPSGWHGGFACPPSCCSWSPASSPGR